MLRGAFGIFQPITNYLSSTFLGGPTKQTTQFHVGEHFFDFEAGSVGMPEAFGALCLGVVMSGKCLETFGFKI